MEEASPLEQMIISAAKLIKDRDILMVGTQWPIIVSLFAKRFYCPNITICYEGGVVLQKIPDRIPLFTGDPVINSSSIMLSSCLDTLGSILHGGRADMALLSAASVDRFGNINTTCVGRYNSPAARFGGSGGACDFGSLAKRTVIILEHDKKRFPERVDFITTPGYLSGSDSRGEVGLKNHTGPYAVVTTLGIFKFDNNGEMILSQFQPGSSVDEIRGSVQWELKVAEDVRQADPATEDELRVLRDEIDPKGMYLREARLLQGIR